MGYFAYYKEIGDRTLLSFETREDRDEWVNYLDSSMVTRDSSPFTRLALGDSDIITQILESYNYDVCEYEDDPGIVFYESPCCYYIFPD